MTGGVILYGPPAAGKDTITKALSKLDSRYRLFSRLKAGPGRTEGYRMASLEDLEKLRRDGGVVWENQRYNASYVVDRQGLADELAACVPVLHLGQAEAIDRIIEATPTTRWLTVYVWCPRPTAAERIVARATGDTPDRLRVWDETPAPSRFDLKINSGELSPEQAAEAIDSARMANQR